MRHSRNTKQHHFLGDADVPWQVTMALKFLMILPDFPLNCPAVQLSSIQPTFTPTLPRDQTCSMMDDSLPCLLQIPPHFLLPAFSKLLAYLILSRHILLRGSRLTQQVPLQLHPSLISLNRDTSLYFILPYLFFHTGHPQSYPPGPYSWWKRPLCFSSTFYSSTLFHRMFTHYFLNIFIEV